MRIQERIIVDTMSSTNDTIVTQPRNHIQMHARPRSTHPSCNTAPICIEFLRHRHSTFPLYEQTPVNSNTPLCTTNLYAFTTSSKQWLIIWYISFLVSRYCNRYYRLISYPNASSTTNPRTVKHSDMRGWSVIPSEVCHIWLNNPVDILLHPVTSKDRIIAAQTILLGKASNRYQQRKRGIIHHEPTCLTTA